MSLVSLSSAGVLLGKSSSSSHSSIVRFADLDSIGKPKSRASHNFHPHSPDGAPTDDKWPAWKVTVGVLVFCGAFWGGVIWLGMRLLG